MNAPQETPLFGPDASASDAFTRRDVLALLFKYKWQIVFVWFGVSLLVGAGLWWLPPSYVSEAKLLIRTEQLGRPSFIAGVAAYRDAPDVDNSMRKLETEMELLLSRPLAEQVVRDLGLRYEQVYHPPLTHLLAPIAALVGDIRQRYFGLPPPAPGRFDDTVDALLKSIKVTPAKGRSGEAPNLIDLEIVAADPAVARDALAAMIGAYQRFSVEIDERNGKRVVGIIEERVALAERAVLDAQGRLEALGARRDATRAAVPGADAVGSQSVVAEGASMTASLRARIAQLEIELAEQQQRFTPQMASIGTLRATIADLKARLDRELRKAARGDAEFMALQREWRLAEERYVDLERRLSQIRLFLQVNREQDASRILVDPPREPAGSEWKKRVALAIVASVAGLLLALLVAALRNFGDHRLTRPADVARYTGLELLAVFDRLDTPGLRQFTGATGSETR